MIKWFFILKWQELIEFFKDNRDKLAATITIIINMIACCILLKHESNHWLSLGLMMGLMTGLVMCGVFCAIIEPTFELLRDNWRKAKRLSQIQKNKLYCDKCKASECPVVETREGRKRVILCSKCGEVIQSERWI